MNVVAMNEISSVGLIHNSKLIIHNFFLLPASVFATGCCAHGIACCVAHFRVLFAAQQGLIPLSLLLQRRDGAALLIQTIYLPHQLYISVQHY